MKDVIIIGAGVTGAFLARELSQYSLSVLALDRETDVGDVTSMANSAIVHSGYDPLPGTKKALYNVEGNKLYPQICRDLDVSFAQIGSLTLALDDEQFALLLQLQKRAAENGVKTEIWDAEKTKKAEPNASPLLVGSLYCPSAGIVNPFTLVAHAFENAIDNGVELHLEEEVVGVRPFAGHFLVTTSRGSYEARAVINAAGLYSDRVASWIGPIDWTLTPRKGEYYVLDHYAPGLVNHVLFPLPSAKGKGVLVAPTTSGNYIIGPSSEPIQARDDYSTDIPTLSSVKEQATAMVPKIPFGQQIRVFSGLRATPSTHDFIICAAEGQPAFINVAGIESPGLASSPAIAKHVVEDLLAKVLPLKKKDDYNPRVKPYVHPLSLGEEERNEFLKEHPDYAQMVCSCEKVTLGEIEDILSRSVPCLTVKALKKRSRAGFGKCQGGFCQPQIVLALARHYGVPASDVLYDKIGSYIVVGKSKEKPQ